MISSPVSNPSGTAVPGPSVAAKPMPGMCTYSQSDSRLATLIDRRRALAAQVAGLDIEIAMALGDRDAAHRARREMEAQIGARRAARECYFDAQGEADRLAMGGAN